MTTRHLFAGRRETRLCACYFCCCTPRCSNTAGIPQRIPPHSRRRYQLTNSLRNIKLSVFAKNVESNFSNKPRTFVQMDVISRRLKFWRNKDLKSSHKDYHHSRPDHLAAMFLRRQVQTVYGGEVCYSRDKVWYRVKLGQLPLNLARQTCFKRVIFPE